MLQPEKKRSRIASRNGTAILRAFVLILTAVLSAPIIAWSAQSLVDARAPDFALKNLAGENLRLSEYRGEVVLLNFWSTSCGRCREQLSVVDDLFAAHEGQGLQTLSISIDHDDSETRRTVADLDLHLSVLVDSEHTVSRLYDLGTLPLALLIDHHGTVRQVYKGFRSGDQEIYKADLEKLLAE
jgi:peroxiredoxin